MTFTLKTCYPRQPRRCLNVILILTIFFGFSYLLQENFHRVDDRKLFDRQRQLDNDIEIFFENQVKYNNNHGKVSEQCGDFRGSVQNWIPKLGVGKARYDNKRMLRIYDFHYTGNGWESIVDQYDVCFAAQTSIERIYWLPYVLDKWTGPLSLAVHISSEEEWLILNLYKCYLSRCHSNVDNQVSMHLAVPANITRTLKLTESILSQWKVGDRDFNEVYKRGQACPEAKEYLNYLLEKFPTVDKEKLKYKEVYPQNHMRNIARKSCGVHWTYSADIDIIPRDGMAVLLQEFYDSRKDIPCDKCAYVIPTFEMNETFPFPKSKKEVAELVKIGAAQQFHGKYYSPAHKATDYKKWTSTNLEEGSVFISHGILSKETYLFEPFYISSDDVPPFDERFLGYGFTRNSQWKAASIAGWNFSVLTPVYSIHWGLQSTSTVFSPKKDGVGKNVRREQTSKNSKIYKKVVEELELKKRLGIF